MPAQCDPLAGGRPHRRRPHHPRRARAFWKQRQPARNGRRRVSLVARRAAALKPVRQFGAYRRLHRTCHGHCRPSCAVCRRPTSTTTATIHTAASSFAAAATTLATAAAALAAAAAALAAAPH